MSEPSRPSTRVFPLTRYFSAISLVAFLAVTATLVVLYRQAAFRDLVELGENKNVALTQLFANSLWPSFEQHVVGSSGATADELRASPNTRAIYDAVRELTSGLAVVKVKIYDLNGLTVFSTDERQIGDDKSGNANFLAARDGRVASYIAHKDALNTFEDEVESRDVIASYVPLRPPGVERPRGVLELYTDVTPLLARIRTTQRVLAATVIAVLGLLYAVLFLVVRRADGIIRSQQRELAEAKRSLEEKARKLARSNEELERFAYVASHDLQEPLRKVQAFGERLESRLGEDLDSQARLYLERMRDAAGRMRTLIQDLLAFSRVGSDGADLGEVDLADVARGVEADLEVRIGELGGRVEIGDLPTVRGDATQLRQLLQNLVGNGLKFYRKGVPPVVRVEARRTCDGWLELLVRDNGIGFEAKYAERVFGMFQRLHGRSEYEGTGIGLAVVQKIAERHGGDVRAEGAPGEGATFIVRLPVAGPEGDAAVPSYEPGAAA